mmetsp:Transcript_12033/g.33841  ORF Transcript_12033/g.33841 Transcript_12033/m.33841 type:complete len:304 (-) Transcript_12033:1583-2494(-)
MRQQTSSARSCVRSLRPGPPWRRCFTTHSSPASLPPLLEANPRCSTPSLPLPLARQSTATKTPSNRTSRSGALLRTVLPSCTSMCGRAVRRAQESARATTLASSPPPPSRSHPLPPAYPSVLRRPLPPQRCLPPQAALRGSCWAGRIAGSSSWVTPISRPCPTTPRHPPGCHLSAEWAALQALPVASRAPRAPRLETPLDGPPAGSGPATTSPRQAPPQVVSAPLSTAASLESPHAPAPAAMARGPQAPSLPQDGLPSRALQSLQSGSSSSGCRHPGPQLVMCLMPQTNSVLSVSGRLGVACA